MAKTGDRILSSADLNARKSMAVADEAKSAELIARLERLPFSRWHRSFFILAFFGIMFDAADFALAI
jgi:hypothetical protein